MNDVNTIRENSGVFLESESNSAKESPGKSPTPSLKESVHAESETEFR